MTKKTSSLTLTSNSIVAHSDSDCACECCGKNKREWQGIGIAFQKNKPQQKISSVTIIFICPSCFKLMQELYAKELLIQGTHPGEFSGETPLMKTLKSEKKFQQYRKDQDIIKPPL